MSPMTTVRSPTRRVDDKASIIEDLQANGYCVVGSVLTEAECDAGVDGVWTWLSLLGSGIKRDDPETWKNDRWPTTIHGLVQNYGIGQAPFMWGVRTNPRVREVFGHLWGTQDLVTSMDGFCVKRPPELTSCRFESGLDKSWLHCDESKQTRSKVPTVNGYQCVQGGINLEDSGRGDACFRVLSGSHLLHASAPWEGSYKDWYKLNAEEIGWYLSNGCVDTKVTCPRGGMVLWDSRAIHASTNPVRGREHPRWRYTAFVCMQPRSHVPPRVAKRRRDAFDNGRTTSHWPSRINLFGKKPRTYGKVDACAAPTTGVEKKEEWWSLV